MSVVSKLEKSRLSIVHCDNNDGGNEDSYTPTIRIAPLSSMTIVFMNKNVSMEFRCCGTCNGHRVWGWGEKILTFDYFGIMKLLI